jgi:serine/threonine protein kinase
MGSSGSFPRSNRFELLKELGAGGMGVVYAVYDRTRGERLALKTLRHRDPNALFGLKNEFRALQDLQHPNLVTLNELFCERDQWFFTMELVHGVDLISYVRTGPAPPIRTPRSSTADVLAGSPSGLAGAAAVSPVPRPVVLERAAFDEGKLRDCLAQLAEGLAALHASGRVHRDIKPGNILVEPEGRLVLLDLGLVTQAEPGHKPGQPIHPVGTAGYMAPEQALGKAPSPAADWYSVGVVLFEAITGQLPFDGPVMLVLAEKQLSEAPRARSGGGSP